MARVTRLWLGGSVSGDTGGVWLLRVYWQLANEKRVPWLLPLF